MKKKLSICIFTSLYPPVLSGSAIHCEDLGKNLAQRGHKVMIVTSRMTVESEYYECINGVEIFRIPALRLPKLPIALNFPWLNLSFSPANLQRVLNILKEKKPDVLHLHNHMFDSAFLATAASKHLGIPLVLTIHTIIKHTNTLYDIILNLADRHLLKHFIVQKAAVVLCQDEIVAGYTKRTFDHPRIELVPYGITPLREPDPDRTKALQKKYGIEGGPVILSLGHLHETRNRRELIEILPRLLELFPTLRILIIGYVGTDSTMKLAHKLGVEKSVVLTGEVPHEEIMEYLALADVEAHWFDKKHPHRTPGIAGQEIMMAGKVMLSHATENIYGKGVLKNGENVVLVDPDDHDALFFAISGILGDKQKRKIIQKNAKVTAKRHFGWDAICAKMTETYESLLNG